jgi:hypothetical protein
MNIIKVEHYLCHKQVTGAAWDFQCVDGTEVWKAGWKTGVRN